MAKDREAHLLHLDGKSQVPFLSIWLQKDSTVIFSQSQNKLYIKFRPKILPLKFYSKIIDAVTVEFKNEKLNNFCKNRPFFWKVQFTSRN